MKTMILCAPGLEECEALVVYDLLYRSGVEIELVGLDRKITTSHRVTFETNRLLNEADLSEYEPRTIQLKDPWMRSALKLSGAEVPEDDVCRDLEHYLLADRRVFVWRDRIVFSTVATNPTFLQKEADKRAFLEKYISPKKK